jgi:predicted tellurium resistance membrane protein TerC
MEWIADPQAWIALLTLTVLEIVLGIDNIIFIAILASKLPAEEQAKARQVGLGLAMITRILLLLSLSWVLGLEEALFTLPGAELLGMEHEAAGISGRDLILLVGGLFLIGKSTHEMHEKLEGEAGHAEERVAASFTSVILQIMLLDIVFSLDSVITAIGLAEEVIIMIIAVVIAVIFMMAFVGPINDFVDRHPTVKMLALSFLLLIGVTLVAESFEVHIPKGYIYFAMAFSVFVEMLNLQLRKHKTDPVHLRKGYTGSGSSDPPSPKGVRGG